MRTGTLIRVTVLCALVFAVLCLPVVSLRDDDFDGYLEDSMDYGVRDFCPRSLERMAVDNFGCDCAQKASAGCSGQWCCSSGKVCARERDMITCIDSEPKVTGMPQVPNLSYRCSVDGGNVTFSYSSPGATVYYLRIDSIPQSYPTAPFHEWNDESATTKAITVIPGKEYIFWVHAGNGGGNWSKDVSAAANVTFHCPIVLFSSEIQSLTAAHAKTKDDHVALIKHKSCMFDALLDPPIEDENSYHALLKRSKCEVALRAIETWRHPPDWDTIRTRKSEIDGILGRKIIYGMFIAEAINATDEYQDDNGYTFDFSAMCKPGTRGQWGPGSCVPTTSSPEFMRYLRYIIGRGIDEGIESYLFGQTDYLDPDRLLPGLVEEMRAVAQSKGKIIVFGQQPNSFHSQAYLRAFDYILGPVCVESSDSGCAPKIYSSEVLNLNANAVVAELDWSSSNDDIHVFARMPCEARRAWMLNKVQELNRLGVGFSIPFRAPLNDGIVDGCCGFNQWVYSPDNQYYCADEDFFNELLSGVVTNPLMGCPGRSVQQLCNSCDESDWSYVLSPAICPKNNRQEKIWTKRGSCKGGVSHPARDNITCASDSCTPADGFWGPLGECSVTCGPGVQTRTCSNPCGGAPCEGNSSVPCVGGTNCIVGGGFCNETLHRDGHWYCGDGVPPYGWSYWGVGESGPSCSVGGVTNMTYSTRETPGQIIGFDCFFCSGEQGCPVGGGMCNEVYHPVEGSFYCDLWGFWGAGGSGPVCTVGEVANKKFSSTTGLLVGFECI
jgi:hypothetical protein